MMVMYFIQTWADWRCLSFEQAMREPKRRGKQETGSHVFCFLLLLAEYESL